MARSLTRWLSFSLLWFAASTATTRADDAKAAPDPREAGVRETINGFTTAFNANDAAKLAALHTPDAHMIDEEGNVVEGRAAIEKEYADLFKENPGAKIEFAVDSIRFVGAETAVEDGTCRVTPKTGTPWINRYNVIYTKADGHWLAAGVREYPGEEPAPSDHIKRLAWLIGDWVEERSDGSAQTSFKWDDDKTAIVGSFAVQIAGRPSLKGTLRIGWDAHLKQFRSWEFDSQGGHSEGCWARGGDDRWVVKSKSVLPDGRTGTATQTVAAEGSKLLHWQILDRTIGDVVLPDLPEFVMARRPPGPK